jgi:hypothetical protein
MVKVLTSKGIIDLIDMQLYVCRNDLGTDIQTSLPEDYRERAETLRAAVSKRSSKRRLPHRSTDGWEIATTTAAGSACVNNRG